MAKLPPWPKGVVQPPPYGQYGEGYSTEKAIIYFLLLDSLVSALMKDSVVSFERKANLFKMKPLNTHFPFAR